MHMTPEQLHETGFAARARMCVLEPRRGLSTIKRADGKAVRLDMFVVTMWHTAAAYEGCVVIREASNTAFAGVAEFGGDCENGTRFGTSQGRIHHPGGRSCPAPPATIYMVHDRRRRLDRMIQARAGIASNMTVLGNRAHDGAPYLNRNRARSTSSRTMHGPAATQRRRGRCRRARPTTPWAGS